MDKCKRCGMCCYVSTCPTAEESEPGLWGRCSHLVVNDDFTTTCTNEVALKKHVGLGCALTRTMEMHENMYGEYLNEFKTFYLKEKKHED